MPLPRTRPAPRIGKTALALIAITFLLGVGTTLACHRIHFPAASDARLLMRQTIALPLIAGPLLHVLPAL